MKTTLTIRLTESDKELLSRIGYGNISRGVLTALEHYEATKVIPKPIKKPRVKNV